MTCKNCGTELEEGVAFCSNCGAQVPAPQPEPIPEPVEVAEAAPVQQEVVDPGKTLGTVSMILGIAGLVLSLVTFCCGYAGAIASPLCIVGLILSIVAKKKSASTLTPSSVLFTRPAALSASISITAPSSNLSSRLATLTIANSLPKILTKPLLGRRLCKGIWPPSKPICIPRPARAFWPL